MDRVNIGPVRGLRFAIAAFLLSLVCCVVAIGAVVWAVSHRTTSVESKVETTLAFQRALVLTQRENCRRNGNPLREVMREEQEAAITDPDDPRIRRLFPDAPPALAERVIRENNREHRERIAKLHRIDCAAQFRLP